MTLTSLASIDREIADRLESDADFCHQFIRYWAANEVASELRRVRKLRKLTQAEVAELAKTGQSAISRIEKANYDGWTYNTLVTIAEALRARLRIVLEPLEDVITAHRRDAVDASSTDMEIVAEEATAGAVESIAAGDSSGFLHQLTEMTRPEIWLGAGTTAQLREM
jgi:transcriptional regulator with XRE-family HTH domain